MENLKQLMNCKIDLVLDEKDQIESLYEEVGLLRTFFQKYCEKEFCGSSLNLTNVKEEIESIKKELKEIYDQKSSNTTYDIEANQETKSSSSGDFSRAKLLVRETTMVGFEEEMIMLKDQLTGGQKQLDILSIVGMPGIGKTTLAKNVYNDPLVVYHFHIRAWISVSREYRKRDLLLGLLIFVSEYQISTSPYTIRAKERDDYVVDRCIDIEGHGKFRTENNPNSFSDDICGMSDEKLCDKLRKRLRGKRYLIVLDDVWDTKVWVDLKHLFPSENNGSRIVLTSQFTEVAFHANQHNPPLFLDFLAEDESWDLFQHKVFKKGNCPPELMQIGRTIAEKCKGLPLAIVVVCGILANMEKKQDQWNNLVKL